MLRPPVLRAHRVAPHETLDRWTVNILHLYSDWKWTGPVEPVLNLCQELTSRGHSVTFCHRKPPEPAKRSIAAYVGNFKVKAADHFRLDRYFSPWANLRDIAQLRRFVRENSIDVVHTHLDHDHALAALALMGNRIHGGSQSGQAVAKPVLVRSDHKRDSLRPSLPSRLLLRRTQGVITFSQRARRHLLERFGMTHETVCRVNPAIDTVRFAPGKGDRALRQTWGLSEHDVAVGMVARFQRYRKCELLLRALKQALEAAPNLKVVLIGRGGEMEETVNRPVRELRLEKQVIIAGYLVDNYISGLASLDAFTFLIAGSDGTGRALREAMAMGKPVVVNNIGMLPEMIEAERSGLLFNDTAEGLATQLVRLARDAALRQRLGEGAREHALKYFCMTDQASVVEAFYDSIAGAADSGNRRVAKRRGGMLRQPAGS